jgi:hypothetical protein
MPKMVYPLPVFTPEQYDSFRNEIGPDLADSYDKWLKLHREQCDEAIRNGDSWVEIEVKFDEFIAYCRTTGAPTDANTLRLFTVRKKSEGQG